ncbi:MAG TPA: ABC transporter permease [Gemmatimonadales bacterium]|jgi:putative ABC transport system permease protein
MRTLQAAQLSIQLIGAAAGQSPPTQRPAPPRTPPLSIAIERRFAIAAHLRVGDTLSLSLPGAVRNSPAIVSAVYEPAPDPSTIMRRDFHVHFHLAELAALLGEPDRVDRIGVVLHAGTDPAHVAAELNHTAFGYDLFPSAQIAAQSSTTFVVVSSFHRAIALISILASTVFLLCLMMLKIEARRRDVAVLRFIGISRRTVFLSLQLEATVVALTGSLLGAMIAAVASAIINAYYRRAFDTALIFSELTPGTIFLAVGLAIALGLIVGAITAWRLVRLPPLELWSRAA